MVRASIIVVSWNGEEYLGDCLDAIVAQVGSSEEVIVVDNHSTDGSAELVRERYPQAHLIENSRNLGFAGGMNVGLEAAHGKALLSVNQDVQIHQGWLEAMLKALNEPEVGVVGCKLLYPDGTIQHAGGSIEWPRALPDHYGYQQPDSGQWDKPRSVDYVTGAAWGFRRALLDQVGFLDDDFWPGYYEEVDYCFRAQEAGWRVVYVPQAVGVHYESTSLRQTSLAYQGAFHRGRLRFVLKHRGLEKLVADFLPSERAYVQTEPGGKMRQALASAYLSTLLNMPLGMVERSFDLNSQDRDGVGELLLVDKVIHRMSLMYLQALHPSGWRKEMEHMSEGPTEIQFPPLHEHDFQSDVPVIGPVIQFVRHGFYKIAAKWGVLAVIRQQNQINRSIANQLIQFTQHLQEFDQRLQEYEARLIDQDRDLAHLARIVAEIDIRQRYLMRKARVCPKPEEQMDTHPGRSNG